ESAGRDAAGDFPRRRPHAGWRDQAVHARSVLPGNQSTSGHRTHRTDRNLRTAADEYLSHQVPPAGDASGRAHSYRRIFVARDGKAVSEGSPGNGESVLQGDTDI